MKKSNFTFETIDCNNYVESADCLAYMFFNHEPVTRSLGLEWSSYRKMVNRFCKVIGTNGICFMARESELNITAGVITSVDFLIDFGEKFANESENFDDVLEKLAPDIAMTAELAEPFLEKMKFSYGDCLHLFQCGVLPQYAGNHIASRLVDITLISAMESGYKYAAVSCTGNISQQICLNKGFKIENSITYSDFSFDSSKPFAKLDGKYVLLSKELF